MAATIVGTVGLVLNAASLALPAGVAVGHLAILWDDIRWDSDDMSGPDGWDLVGHKTWARRLTSADVLAGSVPVRGTNQCLVVFAGAGRPTRPRDSQYARIPAGGAGFWLGWMSRWHSGALASATYQVGTTVKDEFDGYRHGVWVRPVSSAGDYTPGSVSRHTEIKSLVIPPLQAPAAPTWLTTGSSIDRTAPLTLRFAHQSDVPMDRCRVEVRATSSGTWQYVTPAGTLATTSTEIVTSDGAATIAASQLSAGQAYEMRVSTHNDGGWSPTSVSIIIVARNPPGITGTLTTAHNDLSPLVTWSVVPSLGQQRSWQVRIAPEGMGPDAALDGWSSGVQSGAETSWQAPASNLVLNGGSYVAWVKVTDDALTSAWVALPAAVVSWTPPPAPASISAADDSPPTLTAAGVAPTSLELEWQEERNGEWVGLASTVGPSAQETIAIPLAPYGVPQRYRVRSIDVVDGVHLPSEWTTLSAQTFHDMASYVVSLDGREYLMVRITQDSARKPVLGVAASTGLGARSVHLQRTLQAGSTGQTTIQVWTDAEFVALQEWVTKRDKWRMRWTPERDSDDVLRDAGSTTMALNDVPEFARGYQVNVQMREVTVPWVEQEI